ncbi:STM3941 family protein [Mesorhizobium sp. VK25A]|uniref:STM3941 family protein n=1 Tax=Mesorhizobium vachelliae TaxID=3072309 RepID=A0ABU5A454_9HYPH|nr:MULTISPECIES: STM3941 family protein [unclassified Mesorhizobium]MDX8532471.1 STM3941 family protein [Mesorhizobium sp. VK25D]MDX8547883.1 STM3941 family protein [Mesorhizobium sp. VK25A]
MSKRTFGQIDATEPVEPRIIRGSRAKNLLYLLGGIAFVWIGAYLVRDSGSQSGLIAVKMIVIGWTSIVFFGLCALASVLLFVRPRVLILDGSGLAIGGGIVRSPLKIAWRDIQGFHVRKQNRHKSIGFRFEPGAKTPLNRRPGIELSLPGGGWTLSIEKMVELLNTYRQQALNSEAEPVSAVAGAPSAKLSTDANFPINRPLEAAHEKPSRRAIISFKQALILGALFGFAIGCLQYALAPWPNPILTLGLDAQIGAIVSAIAYRVMLGWRER